MDLTKLCRKPNAGWWSRNRSAVWWDRARPQAGLCVRRMETHGGGVLAYTRSAALRCECGNVLVRSRALKTASCGKRSLKTCYWFSVVAQFLLLALQLPLLGTTSHFQLNFSADQQRHPEEDLSICSFFHKCTNMKTSESQTQTGSFWFLWRTWTWRCRMHPLMKKKKWRFVLQVSSCRARFNPSPLSAGWQQVCAWLWYLLTHEEAFKDT